MRKWLVGLLAAGLCASSALAVTDTLTAGDFTATSTTYTEFSGVTKDSDAVYAGKTSKHSSGAIQLRTSGNDCGIVTTASGGAASKVTIAWNDATDDAREVSVYGSTAAYTSAADLYDSAKQGALLGSLKKGDGATELAITGETEYSFIGLRSKSSALYLDSVEIEWGGEPTPVEFSIALKPAEDFEVVQGKSASITATVKGAKGDITYSWSVDGTPIDLAGNVYEIISEDVGGPYEVKCEADDGVSSPVSASVKYSVIAAPVVDGDQLTRADTEVTGSSYQDWTAEGASGTKYAGNSAGGNESIQLRSTSPSGIVITESAGKDVASVKLEWNTEKTDPSRVVQVYGRTEAYSGPAELYGDDKGTPLGEIGVSATTVEVPEGYPYIGIRSKDKALYLTSVTIGFAGTSNPSISYTGETEKTLPDAAFELVFTLKNYDSDYTWSLVEGEGTLGEGGVYTWTATEAGTNTITVAAVNGGLTIAQKEVTLTAVATYTVSVVDGIENGSVELEVDGATVESPAQLAAGTQVTVVATPVQGYQLDQILLNGQELAANPFTVEGDAEISATFSPKPVLPGVTYTIKGTNTAEITSGDAPEGSTFEYASTYNKIYQLTKGNSMTLTLKGYEGQKVTGLTLSMHSNGSGGAGSLSATCGDATIASIEASAFKGGWSTDYTTNWVAVTPEVTATEIDDDIVISIEATTNSLYCEAITVEYEAAGPATPSIAYTGETEKTLPDAAFELVFTLKNYDSDYTWSLVEGEGTLGEGGVYTWTATEAGTNTITVAAVNGGLTIAQKEVTLTAIATYPITVERVPGGVLYVDKDQAEAGDTVTVTAEPDENMKLAEITVKGETTDLSFTSSPAEFAMPAEAVTISATFEEFEVPPYYFQFESNDLPTGYSATSADVANTGSTAEEVATVPFTLQRAVRGNADGDKKVGAAALRLAPIGPTNAFAFNSAAFSEAITAISFEYGIYGTSDKCDSFTVSTSADGENWTVLADLTATATAELQTFESSDLPDNTLYIRFDATNSVAGNTRRMDIDEIMLWTGAPAPKVVYHGETAIELGGSFDLNFELKNYDGAFEWELAGDGSIADDGLYTWTPGAVGTYPIKVSAVDGEELIADSGDITLTVTGPGPQPGDPAIQIAGPETGVAGQELSCEVWSLNMHDAPVYFAGNYEAPENSRLTTDDIVLVNGVCTFTPDVEGVYWIEFCANDGDVGICDKWIVTVSATPGPQPGEFQITKITKTGDNLVLTYKPEGTPAVLGTASLASPQEWTAVEGAVAGGDTATVPMGAQKKYYIRLQ